MEVFEFPPAGVSRCLDGELVEVISSCRPRWSPQPFFFSCQLPEERGGKAAVLVQVVVWCVSSPAPYRHTIRLMS